MRKDKTKDRYVTTDTLTGEDVAVIVRKQPRHSAGFALIFQDPLLNLLTGSTCPSKNELRVLLAVIASMGFENEWSEPLGELAERLEWERSAVSTTAGKLVRRGLLQVERVPGRESRYRVSAKLAFKGNVKQRRRALAAEQLALWDLPSEDEGQPAKLEQAA